MTRQWNFRSPRSCGDAPRQARIDVDKDLFERSAGREGFFGPSTDFYHRNPPSAWLSVDDALRPRFFDLNLLEQNQVSPWNAVELLFNSTCRIRFWRTSAPMNELARNSDGDDLLFVHRGGGHVFCDYGHLRLVEGDYFVIPRSCTWRLDPTAPTEILMIEFDRCSVQPS